MRHEVKPSAALVLFPLVLGCQTAAGEPAPTTNGRAGQNATAAASAIPSNAPTDNKQEPAIESGPCAGKTAGQMACDGNKLITCEAGGTVRLERTCYNIEKCDADQKTCAPACPDGEVYIPATGPNGFVMGKGYMASQGHGKFGKGHLPNSDTPHKVVLTKPFCMEAHEVTVKMLMPCVEAGQCNTPRIGRNFVTYPKKPDHPVNSFSWPEAKAFCERSNKSLPTEAQWEWAATGGEGHKYAWGDEEPTCELADYTPGVLPRPSADAGCHGGGPSAVGSHPKGDRIWPTGHLHDISGNVWEWCLDNYKPYSGKDEVDPNHLENETAVHVVRGGGWNRSADGIRTGFRGGARYDYWVPGLGFRCVRNPQ